MKKEYVAPEMMKISIVSNEAFSQYTKNCKPYMWGGAVLGEGCETTENQPMYLESMDVCLMLGYPN